MATMGDDSTLCEWCEHPGYDYRGIYISKYFSTMAGIKEVKIYQNDASNFEVGLEDQVDEKRYSTTLWELPQ